MAVEVIKFITREFIIVIVMVIIIIIVRVVVLLMVKFLMVFEFVIRATIMLIKVLIIIKQLISIIINLQFMKDECTINTLIELIEEYFVKIIVADTIAIRFTASIIIISDIP